MSRYFQILIALEDQEKTTTLTCPFGIFSYRLMSFGLCNMPATFQRFMMAIFYKLVGNQMEVFMDDFLVFGGSFKDYLASLTKCWSIVKKPTLCWIGRSDILWFKKGLC